jgi:hypothetical protein
VFRLGRPISYSRAEAKSIGDIESGALLRKEKPLIITSDCLGLTVNGSKYSYIKTFSCGLKGDTNYLSSNAMVTGDWLMAWMHTNSEKTQEIVNALEKGEPANDFMSGIKFVGRISSIRKNLSVNQNGVKTVSYSLNGKGFDELSTSYFYDPALATLAFATDVYNFLGQIGLEAFKYLSEAHTSAGNIQDNSEEFFDKFLDIVVGTGNKSGPDAGHDLRGNKVDISPQNQQGAPYSYLVPLSVATTLGRTSVDERKGDGYGHRSFGYANLLTTLTGVQRYEESSDEEPHFGFLPFIDFTLNRQSNRLRCPKRIKGTFIPVEPTFVNTPLWSVLNQFKNPTINEMYTCLKPDLAGDIMPTIVFRQIPFSTDVIEESEGMPLTRFLSLPRWIIPNELVMSLDLGRSDSRFNFIHVYGQVAPYQQKPEYSITDQIKRNAPIMDGVSVANYGFKPYIAAVACSLTDIQRPNGARPWMEAIADWTIGSENTLNGTVTLKGIQSPIAEGDNVEIDGIAFHIESVSHHCGFRGDNKFFETTLNLCNGMPIDQGFPNSVAPRYPGFSSPEYSGDQNSQNKGDDTFATTLNPGMTVDNK